MLRGQTHTPPVVMLLAVLVGAAGKKEEEQEQEEYIDEEAEGAIEYYPQEYDNLAYSTPGPGQRPSGGGIGRYADEIPSTPASAVAPRSTHRAREGGVVFNQGYQTNSPTYRSYEYEQVPAVEDMSEEIYDDVSRVDFSSRPFLNRVFFALIYRTMRATDRSQSKSSVVAMK